MTAEIITNFIMVLVTILNLAVGGKYIRELHVDYINGVWIYGDELHTLQHFAITSILVILSVLMLFSSFQNPNLPWKFIEHLSYNISCLLIIYPHLISEK